MTRSVLLFISGMVATSLACGGASPSSAPLAPDRTDEPSGDHPAPAEAVTAAAPRPPSSFALAAWPVPAGFRPETMTFPLDFAPELPYAGVEEIRFMPGFFDPKARGYWSYVFAWELDAPVPAAAALERDLEAYFFGLSRAVLEGKREVAKTDFRVSLAPAQAKGTMRGTIHTIDAFTTQSAVDLQVEARTFDCGPKHVFVVATSPRATSDGVWTDLRACADALKCVETPARPR